LAVLEHREVGGGQPADRAAILVEHGDVDLDRVDAGLERGCLGRRELLPCGRAGQQHEPAGEDTDTGFHDGILSGSWRLGL
jgi:hypothetical protein